MKKSISIILTLVMIIAILSAATLVNAAGPSFVAAKDINTTTINAESIYVRGWALLGDGEIDVFGYRIDNGTPVFNASYQKDRSDVWGAYGVTSATANGFEITIDTSKVSNGSHKAYAVVKAKDGNVLDITEIEFTAGSAVADPASLAAKDINEKEATVSEDGKTASVHYRGWALLGSSTIDVFGYRVDNGKEVFNASYTQDRSDVWNAYGVTSATANGFLIDANLSSLKKGEHTFTIVLKGADGTILDVDSISFTITGEDSGESGSSGESENSGESGNNGDNPATSDATVIAVAVIGITALAGIIIGKKAQRK